jgi:hypothetical protein
VTNRDMILMNAYGVAVSNHFNLSDAYGYVTLYVCVCIFMLCAMRTDNIVAQNTSLRVAFERLYCCIFLHIRRNEHILRSYVHGPGIN